MYLQYVVSLTDLPYCRIGVDFHIEAFQICTQPFNLHLWDTAGQERFKSITSAYFRGAQSVILVFDVNDLKTLSATRKWLADAVKENAGQDLNVYLVGSKMDLMNRSGIVYKVRPLFRSSQDVPLLTSLLSYTDYA